MLLHVDDSAQLDHAVAKVIAKFDKLNFNEPLLKVSETDSMHLWSVQCDGFEQRIV